METVQLPAPRLKGQATPTSPKRETCVAGASGRRKRTLQPRRSNRRTKGKRPLSALSKHRESEQEGTTSFGEGMGKIGTGKRLALAGNGVGEDEAKQANRLFWSCLGFRLRATKETGG